MSKIVLRSPDHDVLIERILSLPEGPNPKSIFVRGNPNLPSVLRDEKSVRDLLSRESRLGEIDLPARFYRRRRGRTLFEKYFGRLPAFEPDPNAPLVRWTFAPHRGMIEDESTGMRSRLPGPRIVSRWKASLLVWIYASETSTFGGGSVVELYALYRDWLANRADAANVPIPLRNASDRLMRWFSREGEEEDELLNAIFDGIPEMPAKRTAKRKIALVAARSAMGGLVVDRADFPGVDDLPSRVREAYETVPTIRVEFDASFVLLKATRNSLALWTAEELLSERILGACCSPGLFAPLISPQRTELVNVLLRLLYRDPPVASDASARAVETILERFGEAIAQRMRLGWRNEMLGDRFVSPEGFFRCLYALATESSPESSVVRAAPVSSFLERRTIRSNDPLILAVCEANRARALSFSNRWKVPRFENVVEDVESVPISEGMPLRSSVGVVVEESPNEMDEFFQAATDPNARSCAELFPVDEVRETLFETLTDSDLEDYLGDSRGSGSPTEFDLGRTLNYSALSRIRRELNNKE